MDLLRSIQTSASGLRAQGVRLRTVAENMANADTILGADGVDPYRRKLVEFRTHLDRATGTNLVKVAGTRLDRSDFRLEYNPAHPKADTDGYIKMPNVNTLVEMVDLREAQRSYEANLNLIDSSRTLMQRTVDLLRA
jgi:flagellar basal-body rod protein FlgC